MMHRRKKTLLAILASTMAVGCQPNLPPSAESTQSPVQEQTAPVEEKVPVSCLSRSIADYLVEHGTNPFSEDGAQKDDRPNHYHIQRQLEDGRNLGVYFVNRKGYTTEVPARYSRLEVTIKPVREDQFGYELRERGLSGEFEEFRILTGLYENGYPQAWAHLEGDLDELTKDHIQDKYEHVMQEVHDILYNQ